MLVLQENIRETGYVLALADKPEDIEKANALVQKMYSSKGYETEVLAANFISTFVILDKEEVLGTLSIRFDSEEGLLSDKYFNPELNNLRNQGYKLCEFTKLALTGIKSQKVLSVLFHTAYAYSYRLNKGNLLLIEVNPRHVNYYKRKLGFQSLSEEKFLEELNAPAVLLNLNLEMIYSVLDNPSGCVCIDKTLYIYRLSSEEENDIVNKLKFKE